MLDRYMTEKEVSRLTSIPLATLRNWRHRQRGMPYCKLPGTRSVRYKASDVDAFLQAGHIVPGDEQ